MLGQNLACECDADWHYAFQDKEPAVVSFQNRLHETTGACLLECERGTQAQYSALHNKTLDRVCIL